MGLHKLLMVWHFLVGHLLHSIIFLCFECSHDAYCVNMKKELPWLAQGIVAVALKHKAQEILCEYNYLNLYSLQKLYALNAK